MTLGCGGLACIDTTLSPLPLVNALTPSAMSSLGKELGRPVISCKIQTHSPTLHNSVTMYNEMRVNNAVQGIDTNTTGVINKLLSG